MLFRSMCKAVVFLQLTAVSTTSFAFGLPDLIFPINPIDPGNVIDDPVDEVRDRAREAAQSVVDEGVKLTRRVVDEIANAGEDLVELVKTGKCGGDLCDALSAAVEFQSNVIKSNGDILRETERRLADGKPLDAVWHLAVDPVNKQQEHAAQAALKSSVIRAVGQAAASAYGGPAGAAGYAAWLTYHETDGDLETALRAGAIAFATSQALEAIDTAEGYDALKGVKADAVAQRAAITAAVSGAAVAMSGGSQADIEQAMTKGAVMSVLRDGYRELTKSDLSEDMKASRGDAYCLREPPGSGKPCLPEPEAYIRNEDGSIAYEQIGDKSVPKIDIGKLKAYRPHLGAVDGPMWARETSGHMQFFSRFPGMNAMSFAHDIFDQEFNPGVNIVLEQAVRVGTIAPFIVMTYEADGYTVQELIRGAVVKRKARDNPSERPAEQENILDETTVASDFIDLDTSEIRHLICRKGDEEKSYVLETKLDRRPNKPYAERLCTVEQSTPSGFYNVWHAHYQGGFCTDKFNQIVRKYLERDFTCQHSIGVKY